MTVAIPIRNLYYLYAYAWDQFHFVHRVGTGEESGPDAAPFFAKILLQGCRQIFRRGVDRVYQTFDEELPLLRGRIILTKTLRHGSLDKGRVWCEYDELRHDGLQNQLIRATLVRLREHPHVPSPLKAEIAKIIRTFEMLGVKDIVIKRQDFRRIQLHRNNAFYVFLLHICELVHQGLFPEQSGSASPFASLFEDETRMSRIFERFVRNFFRQEQTMSSHNVPSLEDRLSHASEAKKLMLAKFKKALARDDPAKTEKRRQREAIVAARAQRAVDRAAARQQNEHELAKQAAIAAEVAAEAKHAAAEQAAREAAEQAEREATLKAEQKVARDTRYAARKTAKKERRRGY